MPTVFIPAQLRERCENNESVYVSGTSVREIIAELDLRFPGIATGLAIGDRLSPGLAVSIDGAMSTQGLAAKVPADAEVHFLPAIGGG